jgi:serine protease Do
MFKKIALLVVVVFSSLSVTAQAVELPDFTELSEQLSPSVVKIGAVAQARGNQFQQGQQPEVPEIFRYFFDESPFQAPPGAQRQESSGSGFIVSSDGYILTNNHVIEGADQVTVWMTDRTEYMAKVVGTDPRTDIALLKIDAKNLPAVKLGDSDDLKVGEWVLAIGSPFNLDYSVTAGIVSAIGRNIGENYVPFIQTDVAINPGNSGGPLFNLDGEVVGINSQIYTRSGGYMGVSFAIPANLAENVMQQLKDSGRVARGWLGVVIQNVDQGLAESFGLKKPQGALVSQVLENSPAAKAGLEAGDIILEFNGRNIVQSSDLPPMVGKIKPGERADVEVLREGDRETSTVRIEELPGNEELAERSQESPSQRASNPLNLVVQNLTRQEMQQLGESGVRVMEVLDGPGAAAGVQPGDVITMVGSRRVEDVRSFERTLSNIPEGRAFALRLLRNGRPIFLPARIE